MDIHNFRVAQLFSNSQGKTSMSLLCAGLMVFTGCFMGIRGSFTQHSESILQGIAFATLGSGLLAVRRYTPDKEISEEADKPKDK